MNKEKKMSRVMTTYEFPNRPAKKSFGQFLYDKDTGYICGRTTKGWGQLMLFYLAFYIVLAALFTICMQTLLATMNHQFPKWQLDASLIGTNPGLAYRPMPDDPDISGTAIEYRAANKTSVKEWVERLDNFLAPYRNHELLPGGGKNQVPCDFDTKLNPGQVCEVDVKQFTPCTSEQGYSYNKSAPCVFVKLNKIYGWLPEYYDDVDDLPEDMPTDLVDHIKSLKPVDRQQVWLSCKGLSASEDIGPVEYSNRGFQSYYYPYTNQQGYLSPLVAVHFARPPVKINVNVECRAWAKNVMYRGGSRDRRGSIHFVLRVD